MIDWRATQTALVHSGLYTGVIDGDDGPATYTALTDVVGTACLPVGHALARYVHEFEMTTPQRLSEFLAQIANETGGFTRWEENLNYSAQGLANTWPGRYAVDPHAVSKIPNPRALAIAHNPEAIGNDTYALRMGNLDAAHDTDSHPDGWQYRGRGALQLTGRAQYARFGELTGLDLLGNPDLASDPYNSTLIALWFWRQGNVNHWIDLGDFRAARGITNCGSPHPAQEPIGLTHVAELRALELHFIQ